MKTRPRSTADSLLLLLCLFGLALLITLLLRPIRASGATDLPVALHSTLFANYGVDPRSQPLPPVDLRLLQQVLEDQNNEEYLPQMVSSLLTPVPTITPQGTLPTLTYPTSSAITPRATALLPTTTPRVGSSSTPVSITPTPTIPATFTATATYPAPTQTPSSTPTVRPSQPPTSLPASSTPTHTAASPTTAPTRTPTRAPTSTPTDDSYPAPPTQTLQPYP